MTIDQILPPRIEIIEGRAIPAVWVPREGYENLVREFYAEPWQKEEVEQYAEALRKALGVELRLVWHEKLGLKNIGIGISAGFDLHNDKYVEHNIHTLEQAVPVFLLATKYVSLLQ